MAITLRKLSSDEAAQAFPKRGQMDLSDYTTALQRLEPGDTAEFQLNGLSSRAAKRRLGQAAGNLGYRLKWARTNASDRLYFQVLGTASPRARRRSGGRTASPEAPQPTSEAAPVRRRGRPRRTAAA
ncbi:MAG TPA: hypothetical protein VK898_17585 [Chloroflexota bacterium]|nr:hypothetical protein [Chloroflexota bacterium]